jgi:hypothetical protein
MLKHEAFSAQSIQVWRFQKVIAAVHAQDIPCLVIGKDKNHIWFLQLLLIGFLFMGATPNSQETKNKVGLYMIHHLKFQI